MDSGRFKKCGYECVEWAIKYMETLDDRKPLPNVQPGWLWDVCPATAPEKPEPFDKIMRDIEPVVLDGMAHWQHRQFFSYFPAGNAWSSIMGDIFSNATGVNGTNWNSCPVVTELEMIICDWACKFLGLPRFFLSKLECAEGDGAGIIQHSASEAIFYSMMWAREDAVRKLRQKYPNKPRAVLLNMLVAYCNNECHSCVERGALMGAIRLRKLEPDNEGNITADTLRDAINEDMDAGLIPFFHCAIIGSTGITSTDDLMQVGPLCEEYGMWLHCDAAYAGPCFSCLEMRHLLHGFEYVWSTNCNTNKWMMCNFEASLHWVRYSSKAVDPMTGWDDDVYKQPYPPDLRHYAVPATRRFRAFKLWCVIRNYGVEGIRRYCRNHINLAKLFEKYVKRDKRFEVCGPVRFGLTAFRLRGLNEVTSRLLDALNFSRKIHMVPSHFHDKVVIRFAVCAEWANEDDVDTAWRTIDEFASVILRQYEKQNSGDTAMKAVFDEQHHHDEIAKLHKDSRVDREEAEAAEMVKELERKIKAHEDGMIKGVDFVAVNGAWDRADQDTFKKFDEYLQKHPELMEDDTYHDPNFPTKVQSLLHFDLISDTVSHNPEEEKKGKGKDKDSKSKANVSGKSKSQTSAGGKSAGGKSKGSGASKAGEEEETGSTKSGKSKGVSGSKALSTVDEEESEAQSSRSATSYTGTGTKSKGVSGTKGTSKQTVSMADDGGEGEEGEEGEEEDVPTSQSTTSTKSAKTKATSKTAVSGGGGGGEDEGPSATRSTTSTKSASKAASAAGSASKAASAAASASKAASAAAEEEEEEEGAPASAKSTTSAKSASKAASATASASKAASATASASKAASAAASASKAASAAGDEEEEEGAPASAKSTTSAKSASKAASAAASASKAASAAASASKAASAAGDEDAPASAKSTTSAKSASKTASKAASAAKSAAKSAAGEEGGDEEAEGGEDGEEMFAAGDGDEEEEEE